VIVPSPGSGYAWDPHLNFDTAPLAPVPERLLPSEKVRIVARPIRPVRGLSPYGEAAIDSACRAILVAPAGEQEGTINAQSFALGALAGAGGIPTGFARRALLWAARQVPSYDHRRPWRPGELDSKVHRAFDAGLHQPRAVRRAS
jgi:hypothetical protein